MLKRFLKKRAEKNLACMICPDKTVHNGRLSFDFSGVEVAMRFGEDPALLSADRPSAFVILAYGSPLFYGSVIDPSTIPY